MRRLLVIGGTLTGVALVVRPLACRLRGFDMAARIEAMPDTSPRKWMFTNIKAIRQNTERILEILESAPSPQPEAPPRADVEADGDE